jgi:NAD(P)-dependent dehydrogenase (short-subunit alcohol dehydrogenase family)
MKSALITGSTNGIGFYTAKKIAENGYYTIIHGRSQELCESAVKQIITETGNKNVSFLVADFGNLSAVKSMSKKILTNFDSLDLLINNAGATFAERQEGIDGNELTLTINYLAPFLLTNALLPLLRNRSQDDAKARVINVSTLGSNDDAEVADESDINWDDIQTKVRYSLIKSYWRSKVLLNVFTFMLAEKEVNSNVNVNAVHPGTIRTNMTENIAAIGIIEDINALDTIEYGASRLLNLALTEKLELVSGKFFAHKQKELKTSKPNNEAREKLWKISSEHVQLH